MDNCPEDRKYTKNHVWLLAQKEGDYVLGISEFAQQQLGDIVFVELPKVGDSVRSGDACAVIESVKSASDVICSISGEVVAINESLSAEPELLNESPLGAGWLLRIKSTESVQGAMTVQEYDDFLAIS